MDGLSQHHPHTGQGKYNLGAAIFILVMVFIAGTYYLYSRRRVQSGPSGQQQSAARGTPFSDKSVPRTISLEALGLSLEIPAGFTVHTEEPDPGRIYTAYIQNYPFNSPPPETDAYQLYILWQKDTSLTRAQFQQLKENLQPGVVDTQIAGFPAISGQVAGERPRFVTYILRDGGQISIFTSEPTAANKAITDSILSSILVTGEECGVCSQFVPPAPDFCTNGRVVSGGTTACGCPLPPVCLRTP